MPPFFGTLLGGLVCWMRMSRRKWVSTTAKVYIDIMRGTPVLVLLMLMYYVVMAPVNATGRPLYIAFVRHETVADYMLAVETITQMGYAIRGIVIDGMCSLFG
ncbi:MAG: ABC transporter permease subunit, partial [Bacteroidales bacterium]|nr:ABC transporter permease subunit [Bacteroidales bacterium]